MREHGFCLLPNRANLARKAVKILDAPPPADKGKPLSLAALIARAKARQAELQQASGTGNSGQVFLVRVAQGREMRSWLDDRIASSPPGLPIVQ
jgi:hypothetical protein